jgi:hypothetical protein
MARIIYCLYLWCVLSRPLNNVVKLIEVTALINNSILIYLRANSAAQGPITEWTRMKETQSRKQGNL